MAIGTGRIIELRLEEDGLSGKITCPAALRPSPGQYLAASGARPDEAFPTILFPSQINQGEITIAAPLPEHWKLGMELALRGPLGKGFQMPPMTRRLALANFEGSPDRLLPLAYQALTQRAAVTLYARRAPAGLPVEVEILPLELLPEALQWSDFLALEISLSGVPLLREHLGLAPHQRAGCSAQVLVDLPMPCCGLSECGVCAVHTRDGWVMGCTEGPVFDLTQLVEGG